MMRYDYEIIHVPGKYLYTADTLSRIPNQPTEPDDSTLQTDTEALISGLPATPQPLNDFRKAQTTDKTLLQVIQFCQTQWPTQSNISNDIKPYWTIRNELSICEGLLLRDNRIVVPTTMQTDVLQRLHDGHQGLVKCNLRARNSVWWPGIKTTIQQCHTCSKTFQARSEPLLPSQLPLHPWEKVGLDLFQLKGTTYLLVIDYFSRYIEVRKLSSTTSKGTISALKEIFGTHGMPDVFLSDNGPQYSS